MNLSEVFKALGDDTRLRILNLLSVRELCVCQIIETLEMKEPNASKHLNRLRYAGIISCRKIAQWCFYGISNNFLENNRRLLDFLSERWEQQKRYIDDRQRLDYLIEHSECCKAQMQLLNRNGANKKSSIMATGKG